MRKSAFAFCLVVMALAVVAGMSNRAVGAGYAKDIVWQKNMGGATDETFHSMVLLPDESSVLAGYSNSREGDIIGNQGKKDVLVANYAADGKLLWSRVYGGIENDLAYSIDRTSDGGFVLAGSTEFEDVSIGYHGAFDALVMRLDSAGNLLWKRCYGGNNEDTAYSVQQTADGGFILGGSTHSVTGDVSMNNGAEDAWVVKLGSAGEIQWEKCLGGPLDDMACCVQQTTDGGYIAAGRIASNTEDELSDAYGLGNVLVAKLDASGTVKWQKNYGGVDEERAYSIHQTADGGYIVAGAAGSTTGIVKGWKGSLDAWILKLDQDGNIVWQNCFGGVDDDLAYSTRQVSGGGFVFVGETSSFDGDVQGTHSRNDAWVVSLDSDGNILWQKTLGGVFGDAAYDFRQTFDGMLLIGGTCTPLGAWDLTPGHAAYDAWIFKIRP